MSVASEITRLTGLRDGIRTDLIGAGLLPSGSTTDLAGCKSALDTATANGTQRLYNMSGPLAYMGLDIEWVKKIYSGSWLLKDTAYHDWVLATTAKVIVASQTLSNTADKYAADMANYDYIMRWRVRCDLALTDVTPNTVPVIQCTDIYQVLHKRPSSRTNAQAEIYNGNVCNTQYTCPRVDYYNSSGTETVGWTSSYGFYGAAVAATFSNSTSDTPTVTFKTPSVSARCNTTYFATTSGPMINENTSTVKMRGDLYRVKKGSTFICKAFENVIDIYNDDFVLT